MKHLFIDNLWPLCIRIDVKSHGIFISPKQKSTYVNSGASEKKEKIGCFDSGKIVCLLWFKKLSELYLKSIQNLFECYDNENV